MTLAAQIGTSVAAMLQRSCSLVPMSGGKPEAPALLDADGMFDGRRSDEHQVDCDGRVGRPGDAGCFLEPGAWACRGFASSGLASWTELPAHVGGPPETWDDGAYIEDPGGVGPGISFLRVPEPKVVKNRVHLDVEAGGGRSVPWQIRWPRVTEAVERLIGRARP